MTVKRSPSAGLLVPVAENVGVPVSVMDAVGVPLGVIDAVGVPLGVMDAEGDPLGVAGGVGVCEGGGQPAHDAEQAPHPLPPHLEPDEPQRQLDPVDLQVHSSVQSVQPQQTGLHGEEL